MKKALPIIITVAVIILAFFATVILGNFTLLYTDLMKPKEEKVYTKPDDTEYIYTDEEILEYAGKYYGEAELIDSVYVTDPKPMRIFTLRDVKRGFEYTFTSYKVPSDMHFFRSRKGGETDFRDNLVLDMEKNIKTELENEGIVLFYDEDPEQYLENKTTAYSIRQEILVTPASREEENKKIIKETIDAYDPSPLIKIYITGIRNFEDGSENAEENEDNTQQ